MYIRVTRTVQDRGVLVHPSEVSQVVVDRAVDWYRSAFLFGEDAKEYWDAHGDSIKGYNGEVYTDVLYWDLDCKQDVGKAKKAAIDLLTKLESLGVADSVEVYFSGNKGFHILLNTENKFTNVETSAVCYNLAKEAGIPQDVFDMSVYNVTRIFRITNTKHNESGLYKIPLTREELQTLKTEEIRTLAAKPRFEEFDVKKANVAPLKEKYAKIIATESNIVDLKLVKGESLEENLTIKDIHRLCPPGHRKCVYMLEQGYFGPSERHAAILRMAAYHRGQSISRKQSANIIFEALERRKEIFPDAEAFDLAECNKDIDEIYSDKWEGGTFTCKTDVYLQSKCDTGKGPCFADAKVKIRGVIGVDQLFTNYLKYGEEALTEYPTFGLPWLDERLRLRPKTFSVLAGANGSGKTSLALKLMQNLNKKKIYHVFFSLDMADSAILEKLGAMYTKYSQRQIEQAFSALTYDDEIVQAVKQALRAELPYTLFDFNSAVTLQYIEQTVGALKEIYDNLQLVIVDYAGRLIGDFGNQYANSTANANKANDVAKNTSTHMMFLSQVSRENGDHTSPLRTSRVSKDSGAWEENASIVLTVWRPFGNGINGKDEYMHIYIGKNRSGPLGENVFNWHGKTGGIEEMDSEHDFEAYCRLCEAHEMQRPMFNWFGLEADDGLSDTRMSPNFVKERFPTPNEQQKLPNHKPGRFKRSH